MLQMTVQLSGRSELLRSIKQAGVDISDLRSELRDVGDYLKEFYATDVYDTRGHVINALWAPLDVRYRKYKQKRAPGKGPLEFSGKMRDSFYSRLGRNQVIVGNKQDYFKFHQTGTRNIPARRMIKLDRSRQEKVVDIIEAGLEKRLKRHWK